MNKNIRKLTAFLVTAVYLFTICPVQSFAADLQDTEDVTLSEYSAVTDSVDSEVTDTDTVDSVSSDTPNEESFLIDNAVFEIDQEEVTGGTSPVTIGCEGTYYTETAEKLLKRINEIRKEACDNGYIDPNTNQPLKSSDYRALKWSADMEKIARIRAAEASVYNAHIRPNGGTPWSITSNGQQSWGENLAWNNTGIMESLEQYYKEKEDWINNNTNAVTGHYESIISTRYYSVGMGCFQRSIGGWYASSMEFSSYDNLSTTKDNTSGKCIQPIDVSIQNISSISLNAEKTKIEAGTECELSTSATTIKFNDYEKRSLTGPVLSGVYFSSSNPSVAVFKNYSIGTLSALRAGTVIVTAMVDTLTSSVSITVTEPTVCTYTLKKPTKTIYKVNEKLSVEGGLLESITGDTNVTLTASMVSGFSSTTEGIKNLTVTYKSQKYYFSVIVLNEPEVDGIFGQPLSSVTLPTVNFGTFTWKDKSTLMNTLVGKVTYVAVFTPNDTENLPATEVNIVVNVYRQIDSSFTITLSKSNYVYGAVKYTPTVNVSIGDTPLVLNKDFQLSYSDNMNVGNATVTISGIGNYTSSVTKKFFITQAPLIITADDQTVRLNGALPESYSYCVDGLCGNDTLITEPTISCDAVSTNTLGTYNIVIAEADAGDNYSITYKDGTLSVVGIYNTYNVTFDLHGHGISIPKAIVNEGNLVEKPADPTAEGYTFVGWYTDGYYLKTFNFNTDTIHSDLVLHAKWLKNCSNNRLSINEIPDMTYTGSPIKPQITVYDGATPLILNKDYTITYMNNTNVNFNYVFNTVNPTDDAVIKTLPYVIIKGKGNYCSQLLSNFDILPADIDDGALAPAPGVTLKFNEQLNYSKTSDQTVFTSIKAKKTMKKNVDFSISLRSETAFDATGSGIPANTTMSGEKIPKGYYGSFVLVVNGIGNYCGSIERKVYVSEKAKLMRNATVSLGNKLKNKMYTGNEITLNAGFYDATIKKYFLVNEGEVTQSIADRNDIFTVNIDKTHLIYKKDFDIIYTNNKAAGTATMTVIGINGYTGSKSVTFNIIGYPFNAKKVSVSEIYDSTYSGIPILSNHVVLEYKTSMGTLPLVINKDYTITSKNNINKGTATVTFIGNRDAGFSGQFSKTFKINPAVINNPAFVTVAESMNSISVEYDIRGAKPFDQIVLTNMSNQQLVYNKDYTVTFQNNKVVADLNASKAPMMIIKGKGNYTGTLRIPFSILKKDFLSEDCKIFIKPIAYNSNAKDSYIYKPTIKITDSGVNIPVKKELNITVTHNTQADYTMYMKLLSEDSQAAVSYQPTVTIELKENSNYSVEGPVKYLIPIYKENLTASNTIILVSECKYSQQTSQPNISVFYSSDKNVMKKAKNVSDETQLIQLGMIKLNPEIDYRCQYGNNNKAGSTTGSVTITAIGSYYGGSVTKKFVIKPTELTW